MRKKFRVSKILPKLILKEKTFSPKKLRDAILLGYNEEMSPQNISNWLRRHPQIVKELNEQIGEIDAQHENIRFDRDYWFNEFKSSIPIIQTWIDTMIFRKVNKKVIRSRVHTLRKMCMGLKGTDRNPESIMDWKLHPLALTEEKGVEYITELEKRGHKTHRFRLTIRSFLLYGKGEQPTKIGGEKVFGKYGHLFTTKQKIQQILVWIETKDYKTYIYCKFLYKTATRAMAAILAKLSHLNEQEKIITVFDKGRRGEKIRWEKHLDDEMLNDLRPLIEQGKLFEDIDIRQARNLCKEAYKLFIPQLAKEIPMPLHFWRHMFAQHMLRATNWNYTIVAMLGGWKDEKTLKENYGMPPEAVVKKWGLQYVPLI